VGSVYGGRDCIVMAFLGFVATMFWVVQVWLVNVCNLFVYLFIYYYFINMNIHVSLYILRLISWALKLMII
jgi:hypothetical protein